MRIRNIFQALSIGQEAADQSQAIPLACSGEAASELLGKRVISKEPFLAARFGSGELEATAVYLRKIRSRLYPGEKSLRYMVGAEDCFWWHMGIRNSLKNNAGMFSVSDRELDRFSNIMLGAAKEIDILGSWRKEESLLGDHLQYVTRVGLSDLEPYYHTKPWSKYLTGLRVVVIHPFATSIKSQYLCNRKRIHKNPDVLPEFELSTYVPVQTIAGNRDPRFGSWFEALDHMISEIIEIEFDIALIGAGAYGLPLGAALKRHGRKAIHLGGATQILFGIKGNRWNQDPFFRDMFNEHWVSPQETEKPPRAESVEGGCYW